MGCPNIYFIIFTVLFLFVYFFYIDTDFVVYKKKKVIKINGCKKENYDPSKDTTIKGLTTSTTTKNVFLHSKIINNARQINLITGWIPDIKDTALLYSSNGNNITLNSLYDNIVNKGRIMILATVTDSSVFSGSDDIVGAYTSLGWTSSNPTKLDPNVFTFNLTKSTIYSIPSYNLYQNATNISKYGLTYPSVLKGPSIGKAPEFEITKSGNNFFVKTNASNFVGKNGKVDGPFAKGLKQKKIVNIEIWQIL